MEVFIYVYNVHSRIESGVADFPFSIVTRFSGSVPTIAPQETVSRLCKPAGGLPLRRWTRTAEKNLGTRKGGVARRRPNDTG